MSIFQKSFKKIQVSLKSDNNNGYFTPRPIHVSDHISLCSSHNEKCFRQATDDNTAHAHRLLDT